MRKIFCDMCSKEIGRDWFELKHIGKESDWGMELRGGTLEICSLQCLLDFVKKRMDDEKNGIKYHIVGMG